MTAGPIRPMSGDHPTWALYCPGDPDAETAEAYA